MFTSITRVAMAVAAATALTVLGVVGAGGSGPHARAAARPAGAPPARAMQPTAVRGAQVWKSRLKEGVADAMAVSPDGGTVFLAGGGSGGYLTVAEAAATGAHLWTRSYNGPGNGRGSADSVAVSPDGATVFVTGTSQEATTNEDYATVAYAAATGARLWAHRYNGPGNSYDEAASVVASPDGSTVFVTGTSTGTSSYHYATVAYNAATGAQLWVRRYAAEADMNASVAVSPDGSMVFVTGTNVARTTGADYATVAYNAATGAQLWTARYNHAGTGPDMAQSVAVSPDGGTVYVTGASGSAQGYATVAYNAATDAQLWAARYNSGFAGAGGGQPGRGHGFRHRAQRRGHHQRRLRHGRLCRGHRRSAVAARYNGTGNSYDNATSMAVSPHGTRSTCTGYSQGVSSDDDYATVAYDTVTGAQLWAQRFNDPGNFADYAESVAASPTGGLVFVTGSDPMGQDHHDRLHRLTPQPWQQARPDGAPAASPSSGQ